MLARLLCSHSALSLRFRLYSTAARILFSRTEELLKDIRDYEKKGPVPWYELVGKYHEAADRLKLVYQQAIDETRIANELSQRVTKAAREHYNSARDRVNWTAVSKEVGLPLIECLKQFDYTSSGIKQRSIPAHTAWDSEEAKELREFVTNYFSNPTTDDWNLVGRYMNIAKIDCMDLGAKLSSFKMTKERFDEITRYREAGLPWKDIVAKYDDTRLIAVIPQSYSAHAKRKRQQKTEIPDRFSKDEILKLKELRLGHPHTRSVQLFYELARAEFPLKSDASVKEACARALVSLRMASAMGVETFSNLQNLVRQYGENWDVIGREMHALPSMLKHAWKGYSVDTKITAQWTADELATLRHCEKSNIPPAKAARIIGTKLPAQCMNIRKSLRHSDFNDAERASNKKLKWTAEQDQELDRLAKIHIRKGGVDWAVVARDTGRTVRSCLARHARIKHDADLQQQGELAIRVSSEVKRQRESGTEVDWALVAELVGATELECLECSTYDEGKQRWSYDHRTFSWDLPNRMRDFIDKYYPNPLIPSFAAVSNYLWVAHDDCVDMHRRTTGKLVWNDELRAEAVELRAKKLRNGEIAQRLAPMLTDCDVATMFYRMKLQSSLEPLSDQVKEQIRAAADKLVGKIPCADIPTMVKKAFPDILYFQLSSVANGYLTTHPLYKERYQNCDQNEVARRISEDKVPTKQIAQELDIPVILIGRIIKRKQAKDLGKWWTKEETDKLVAYAKPIRGRINWRTFASIIGTKSPNQCSCKWSHLRMLQGQK